MEIAVIDLINLNRQKIRAKNIYSGIRNWMTSKSVEYGQISGDLTWKPAT